jgi:flagella basal body P-ring formation protein FlgA
MQSRYLIRVLIRACLASLMLALSSHVLANAPQQAMETALAQWVAAQSGGQPDQVKMAALDPRVQVQPCAGSFSFDYPFVNRENVRVRCSKPNWQMFVKVGFSQQAAPNMVITRRDLPPGHVLTESDLDTKATAALPPGGFDDRASVAGKQLKKALSKGQPVLAQDLEKNQRALRARVTLRAGDLLTESAIERVDLPPSAGGTPLWVANELTPGMRMARSVPAGQVLQTADVAESRQVVIATSNLNTGQPLKPEMFKLDRLDAEKISRTHLFDLSGLDGYELMRPLRAGEALRTSDLRPALMVKKGDQVNLIVGRPPEFMISVRVEAMQDGRLNEQIKLRNPESGTTLSGIITGKGAARGL